MVNIEKSNLNIIIPGFGCCKGEILAAKGPVYDIQRFGINIVSIPEDADILVLSGFMGEAVFNEFIETYNRMKTPRWVFAVGSCAIHGERFCGKFAEKLKTKIPVDMYVPGCPPRPEAFIYTILKFLSENTETGPVKVKNV